MGSSASRSTPTLTGADTSRSHSRASGASCSRVPAARRRPSTPSWSHVRNARVGPSRPHDHRRRAARGPRRNPARRHCLPDAAHLIAGSRRRRASSRAPSPPESPHPIAPDVQGAGPCRRIVPIRLGCRRSFDRAGLVPLVPARRPTVETPNAAYRDRRRCGHASCVRPLRSMKRVAAAMRRHAGRCPEIK